MDFVPVANTVLAELIFYLDGQIVENTLYFENSTEIDSGEMLALAEVLRDWWGDELAPRVSQSLLLQLVKITELTTALSPSYTLPVTPNLPGGVAGDCSPNSVTVCVSFRTAGRGRSSRGRNYIPAIPEALTLASRITLGIQAEYTAAYNALLTVLPVNWTWVVVSRFSEGLPRAAGLTLPITSAVIVDNVVDSQRRRLPGRGR